MHADLILTTILIWWVASEQSAAYAVTRMSEYANRDRVLDEPNCEQLKAMWRFSKRQSRAHEITNELPSYIDPFAFNVWNPVFAAKSRSAGGFRVRTRPVYGKVLEEPPATLRLDDTDERSKAFEEIFRLYGQTQAPEPRRRFPVFRIAGGHSLGLPQQRGSFQHLKNLIQSERARELKNQHLAEKAAAARAGFLNRISGKSDAKNEPALGEMQYSDNVKDEDEQETGKGIMMFPDVLAPASHQDDNDGYYKEDPYKRAHNSALPDPNNFNGDVDVVM